MKKRIFSWLQLVRFPNVFVIAADFLTVTFFTLFLLRFSVPEWTALGIAGLGSVLLYWSGMILNDCFDAGEDAVLRPERPIPSGRISLASARKAGWTLWGSGLALCSIPAFFLTHSWLPGAAALTLAVCIYLYDAVFKNTPVGPFFMGLCRGMNVLMFLSFWPTEMLQNSPILLYPMALTLYISGVTFYARCETEDAPEAGLRRPGVPTLLFAAALLGSGMALLLKFPQLLEMRHPGSIAPLFLAQPWRWTILFTFLIVFLVFRAITAYFAGPLRTRAVVKQALFTVFLLDAALVLAVCSLPYALGILVLFLAASAVGKWIYST